jgi:hypothetical protein
VSIDAREILRRIVLSTPTGYSDAIPAILRAVVPEATISWAHVEGRDLAVYCYSKRDGHKLEREFGGHTVKAHGRDDYWQWVWEAPLWS